MPDSQKPPQKPVITPEHHERLAAIMKTPTRPAVSDNTKAPSPSKVSALLASLPKPKGVGNKMFIFTGKKKIVLDPGGEKEIHDVKTVDAKPTVKPDLKISPEAQKEEAKSPPPLAQTNKPTNPSPQDIKAQEVKKEIEKKKFPIGFLVMGIIVLLGAWALFWLYFLDFI